MLPLICPPQDAEGAEVDAIDQQPDQGTEGASQVSGKAGQQAVPVFVLANLQPYGPTRAIQQGLLRGETAGTA